MTRCHCDQCRKTSGSAWLAVVPVDDRNCVIEDPEACLRSYRSSPHKARAFCGRCGTPVFSRRDGLPMLRLRAGLFEELVGVPRGVHIFSASTPGWDREDDGLPRYEGLEPGR